MIDIQLKLAAEEFVRYLSSSSPMKEFHNTERVYQHNLELKKLREEYVSLAREFQKRQTNGTLTQEEINKIRSMQSTLSKHPVAVQYSQAQQTMVMMLQDCNTVISEVLGFDFAATAAPAASC
jgi:cell fate (sporulation/competence/biofilm development) regulator YlbF (YheA/YmcA/DUF963 family)